MTEPAFTGSVPQTYDRFMGPLFFEPYAVDLVQRLPADTNRVLELACGTGIVTRKLRDKLPSDCRLVATDLHEGMLEQAATKFRAGEQVEFQRVDAMSLPFEPASFDLVVCQFGWMFFPDKLVALREAARVLTAYGTLLFNVWDRLDANPLSEIVAQAVADFFPADPPDFYSIPFGFHDREEIERPVRAAGFEHVELTTVTKAQSGVSPHLAAVALVEGTPILGQILQRDEHAVPHVVAAAERAIRNRLGGDAINTQMSAIVCTARKGRGA